MELKEGRTRALLGMRFTSRSTPAPAIRGNSRQDLLLIARRASYRTRHRHRGVTECRARGQDARKGAAA